MNGSLPRRDFLRTSLAAVGAAAALPAAGAPLRGQASAADGEWRNRQPKQVEENLAVV